nr:HdeD family acid-resistance protein [Bifidobacterium boum]
MTDQNMNQNPYGPYANNPNPNTGQNPDLQGQNPYSFNPFRLVEEMLPQRAKNTIRGAYGLIGIVALILGIALLVWPGKTLVVAAIALGVFFVISGVIRIVSAIVELGLPAGWRVLDIIVGLLLTVGGIVMFKYTALSAQTLLIVITLTVGICWIVEGIMALTESWMLPNQGWAIFYAIISIIAGIAILFWPGPSALTLMVFGGITLIVLGISAIVRAFTFGKPSKH